MKKIQKYIIALALGIVSYSCYYDQLPDEDTIPLPTNVSFQGQVQPIFNRACVSCHGGSLAPDLRGSNAFNALLNGNFVIPNNAEESTLFKTLLGQGAPLMPPGTPLNLTDINVIRQWINEGALNN
ncbi:hypothetical protein U1E44_10640 [Arenibacter sp. GZD96]|uniref:c-type cytochrome n=1 Tax=Aurantibrevibacter litoralis TaxID=3106030 RepID=UPI002B002E51|nr:hypothetical protein [Arenibacter sp. GZD-96]MEA1786549.1 hypothetical protein [Arenibacter sp. GZD-96]